MAERRFLSRTGETVFLASAWTLPLLVLPGFLMDATELPKMAALALSTILLFGTALSRLLIAREAPFPATPLALPLLALLLSAALSLPGTRAPGPGTHALLYLGAMLTSSLMAASLPSRERLLRALLAASAVVALYGIGQFAGFEPLDWMSHFRPRIFSTFGNPVFLGGFLAAVFPFAFARWLWTRTEEEKDLLTLLLAGLGVALYLTWTRSSWVAVTVSTALQVGLLAATPAGRRVLYANRTWLLTLALLGGIGGAILATPRVLGRSPVPVADRLRDATDLRGFSVNFRLVTSEVALRTAFAHPILGAGVGSFCAWYPLERLRTKAARIVPGRWFASQEAYVHNDHLQFLAEQGVIGLGIWIWMFATAFCWAWSRHRRESELSIPPPEPLPPIAPAAPGDSPESPIGPPVAGGDGFPLGTIGCLAAFATDAMFNFPLHIVPTSWAFFVMPALLAVEQVSPWKPVHPVDPAGRRRLVLAGTLLAALALASAWPLYTSIRSDRDMSNGLGQYDSNNYEMAEMYFGFGTRDAPLDRFMHFRRAACLIKSGRFEYRGESLDAALREAQTAIALGYREENVFKTLGDIYGKKNMFTQAIRAIETAHAINPQREDIMNDLSYYIAERGTDPERAVALAREAVARVKTDPTFNDTLGYALLKAGRPHEAIKPLETALRSLPASNPNPAAQIARREILQHLAMAREGRKP